MAVCVHNLPLVILLILCPLRNENENKLNQNSSVNISLELFPIYQTFE